MKQNIYPIYYEFRIKNERLKLFKINLDLQTISLIPVPQHNVPDWCRLNYCQCECCPLDKSSRLFCPIAVNIAHLVEEFKDMISHQTCIVRCMTPERTYQKKTTIMEALSSIFGIIMATSNCPIMEFLKPMARFHLPFATVEEQMVRSLSLYLLGEYFENKDKSEIHFDTKKFDQHYQKVMILNKGFISRIKAVAKKDADVNAIYILHSISELLTSEIKFRLNLIEPIFLRGK
ncbi:MAG: hypothetical protein HQK77_15475 [Desulfobacterales bacterium]|nr:hypothetical protein [Desulfobacterales bacterium]